MKTREQKRNERSEKVCRELRHYLASAGVNMDDKKTLMKLLLSWMRVAKKNKWERP